MNAWKVTMGEFTLLDIDWVARGISPAGVQ